METKSSVLSVAFLVLCVFLFSTIFDIFLRRTMKRYEKYRPRLPPGPRKLPFIGNLHQLAGAGSRPPWRTFQDLSRKHGPIMHIQVGQITTFVVSSPRLAKEVIKTHDLTFADRPDSVAAEVLFYNKQNIGFAPHGDYWRQMRKVCLSELLGNKKVSEFASIREKEVSGIISSAQLSSEMGSPVNLTKKFFLLSNNITCKAVFGDKFNRTDELIAMMTGLAYFLGELSVADVFPSLKLFDGVTGSRRKLQRMHREVDRVLDNMIDDCRRNTKSDEQNLLAALIRFQQGVGLELQISDATIKSIIFEMFAAGTEPTSTLIDWAFAEMVKNPRVMHKAQAEVRQVIGKNKTIQETDIKRIGYLRMVIKETLRLHPPAPLLIPRQCRETCEIDGYTIPVNTKIVVNAWAIGRDPGSWDDADAFKPERFEDCSIDFKGTYFDFLPFGAGRRMCPGVSFAVSIAEIVLAKMLYHFDDWELPGGMNPLDLDMDETSGFVGRRKHDLCVIPISRDGLSY